jgi:DNA-binding CsgD family transcriptional regulator
MAWISSSAQIARPGSTMVSSERTKIPLASSVANRGGADGTEKKVRNLRIPANQTARVPAVGMVLLDESFEIIACDHGASVLLNSVEPSGAEVSGLRLPRQILEELQQRKTTGDTSSELQFRVGSSDYVCRAYLLETRSGYLTELSFMALHLQKVAGVQQATQEAIELYRLTEREGQTLKGVLLGLCTKELADQMGISPNTVKAFTRLIMIKLGVTTRWGIIAKILGSREVPEDNAHSAAPSDAFR